MLRMEEAFGRRLVAPEDIGNAGYNPQLHSVFGIKDLELRMIRDQKKPVFEASYVRIISSGEKLHESRMNETIYLEYIEDRWYITGSERITEGPVLE
jgi:hypothetical protein